MERRITYDFLVIALGIQIDWNKIPGLQEGIGRQQICSNYSYQQVDYTWECVSNFKGGTALFTMPNTAVKCGGAPQKIMYLADDHFRKSGVRDKSTVIFASAQGSLFAVEKYRKTLEKVAARKAIDVRLKHNLVEIRPDQKEAIFEHLDTKERVAISFDMIHVTPPMSAPDIIKSSTLANAAGWVDVDKYTLQHPKFLNVFPIGDCSGLPTSKTGAAVRKANQKRLFRSINRKNGYLCICSRHTHSPGCIGTGCCVGSANVGNEAEGYQLSLRR